jgi:hypothetical protein
MWQTNGMVVTAAGNPNNREQPWSCAGTLKILAELNEACLELLANQATQPTSVASTPAPPMFRELAVLWRKLDASSRKRAAACPYLLLDAGFCDPYRWRWLGDQQVGTRSTELVLDQMSPDAYTPFFTIPGATKVAHQVFTNAWCIAQTQPVGAGMFLGMPAHCAALFRNCTMRQICELANQHTGWLRPRWTGRPMVWRQLLEAAISGNAQSLELARMHGVQLLAMELKALDRLVDEK